MPEVPQVRRAGVLREVLVVLGLGALLGVLMFVGYLALSVFG